MVLSSTINAQYVGIIEISKDKITTWTPKLEIEYAGIYHFGESENESELLIFFSGTKIIGQIKSGFWENESSLWKWKYENLKNIKIDKNGNFSSVNYIGKFVTFDDGNSGKMHGLQINNPWSELIEKGKFEIGIESNANLKEYFPGEFPEASYQILETKKLKKFSKTELQIMKNEIFARYGYIFQKDSKMEKHFSQQIWYKPIYNNVYSFLNEIELKNIEIIKQFEKSN